MKIDQKTNFLRLNLISSNRLIVPTKPVTMEVNNTSEDISNAVEDVDTPMTEFVFEVVFLSIISIFGLLGNIGAILLFATMKRQLKFHRLMMMLSAFDLIYVVLSFILFALPKVS